MKLFNADAIVRSKDAGPFRFILDVIFNDRNQFEAMKDSGIWNRVGSYSRTRSGSPGRIIPT